MGWDSVSEEKIREAMREGKFDDLPGKGKPLPVEESPFVDPALRLGYHLLKSNGFAPPWMAEQRELQQAVEGLRRRLAQAWRRGGGAGRSWNEAAALFRRRAEEVNRRIRAYNLKAPSRGFQLLPLDVEEEVRRAQAEP